MGSQVLVPRIFRRVNARQQHDAFSGISSNDVIRSVLASGGVGSVIGRKRFVEQPGKRDGDKGTLITYGISMVVAYN